jgi:hypothetical protein
MTCYGLDVPGIESRWGARIPAPVQTGPGAHPASYTMGTGSFPGIKRPGSDVDRPPPSTVEVKERAELYLCSQSGPSCPVLGRTLPLHLSTLKLLHISETTVCFELYVIGCIGWWMYRLTSVTSPNQDHLSA